jgi:hypothetical protein
MIIEKFKKRIKRYVAIDTLLDIFFEHDSRNKSGL